MPIAPTSLRAPKQAGIEALLAIGNGDGPGTGTLDCAIKLSQQYDWVYATVGIHPHEAALAKQADFDELQRLVARAQGDCLGRNRARLLLRPFAARRAAERLPATDGDGPCREAAHHHSLPSLRQQRECLGRHAAPAARALGVERTGGRSALLHRVGRARQGGARSGLRRLLRRKHHVSQGAEHPRRGRHSFRSIACSSRPTRLISRRFLIAASATNRLLCVEVARQIAELRGFSAEEIGRQTAENFYNFFRLQQSK